MRDIHPRTPPLFTLTLKQVMSQNGSRMLLYSTTLCVHFYLELAHGTSILITIKDYGEVALANYSDLPRFTQGSETLSLHFLFRTMHSFNPSDFPPLPWSRSGSIIRHFLARHAREIHPRTAHFESLAGDDLIQSLEMHIPRASILSRLQVLPNPPCGQSNGRNIIIFTSSFSGAALVVVLARLFVRAGLLKKLGKDDCFMVIAMFSSVAVFVCFVAEVMLGAGKHISDPQIARNMKSLLHWLYFHSLMNVVGISCVKISVGFFLLRLVQGKWYKRTLILWIVFLMLFMTASMGTLVFQCLPLNAAWDFDIRTKPATKCYSIVIFRNIGLFNGAINIFTDFLFASLPIPIILPLNINGRTKMTLICILSLGYFACAASIIKEVLLANFLKDTDPFFSYALQIWNDIELNAGILASCLPTLRPLFSKFLQSTSAKPTAAATLNRPQNLSNKSQFPIPSLPSPSKSRYTSLPSSSRNASSTNVRGYRITVLEGGRIGPDGRYLFEREDSFGSNFSGAQGGEIEMDRLEKEEGWREGMDERQRDRDRGVIGKRLRGGVYVERPGTGSSSGQVPRRGILRMREAEV